MNLNFSETIQKQEELFKICEKLVHEKNKKKIDINKVVEFANNYITIYNKEKYREHNPISLRVGAIAITEETILEKKETNREALDYNKIITKTKVRFQNNIANRNWKSFDTIEKIHPKEPCLSYDTLTNNQKINRKNAAKKRHYKEALFKIIVGKNWILDNQNAATSLKTILEEVKKC